MAKASIQLTQPWLNAVGLEFEKDYMQALKQYLRQRLAKDATILPAADQYFAALNHTAPAQTRVVILGQDPYHGLGQAHGLAFSVPHGVAVPPSLKNIYKELHASTDFEIPDHGNLEAWAAQGVLLLNSVLTVEAGMAAAHAGQGWERFTDAIVSYLNDNFQGLVFMLWGGYAQKKGQWIDRQNHRVLSSPHPSPLSAYRGFLGSQHFVLANRYLISQDKAPIDWAL